jgi:predicted acetyltransferase
MTAESISLVKLAVEHESEFLAMLREYQTAGEGRYRYALARAERDFGSFVLHLNNGQTNRRLRKGRVPQTHYWLVRDDGYFLAGSRLRHWLTPALEREGGHIGYDVRPSERGKGYGILQLGLTLEKARDLGLARILVTCDTDNYASARIIKKNGGRFENELTSDHTGKPVSRYEAFGDSSHFDWSLREHQIPTTLKNREPATVCPWTYCHQEHRMLR